MTFLQNADVKGVTCWRHCSAFLRARNNSKPRQKSKQAKRQRRRREMKEIAGSIERLRKEMEEIGEEQKSIRDGQQQVRLKFQALASQCQQLRHETDVIMRQSAATQQRLALMFAILRARDNGDFATAENLASLLRGMITNAGQKPV